MRADRIAAECRLDPPARRSGIGHRLDGREGLGSHDHQRRRRIEICEHVVDMRAVHVRYEVQPGAVMVRRERERRHGRPEIGAADADVDDVRDRLARGAFRLARTHRLRERRHAVEHVVHVLHDITAVHLEPRAARRAQRHVQHGTAFGGVDGVACKHRVAAGFHVRRLGKPGEEIHRARVDRGLRPVDKQVVEPQRKPCETARIGRKRRTQILRCEMCGMCVEFRKHAGEGGPVHGGSSRLVRHG